MKYGVRIKDESYLWTVKESMQLDDKKGLCTSVTLHPLLHLPFRPINPCQDSKNLQPGVYL